ncbi:unnamed protein product [Timema podura]|uniref:Peptidase aspartic putative domain-containing protein n=1 Tax=Timema podura TaxID=61482 RepID=A0ABN7NQA3_TIMPD|nr:unnamed protein product [Timema podura]
MANPRLKERELKKPMIGMKLKDIVKDWLALNIHYEEMLRGDAARANRENAAESYDVLEVKILLGANILTRLLTGKIEVLDEGMTAVETKLGWTVMGQRAANCHKSQSDAEAENVLPEDVTAINNSSLLIVKSPDVVAEKVSPEDVTAVNNNSLLLGESFDVVALNALPEGVTAVNNSSPLLVESPESIMDHNNCSFSGGQQ